MPVKFCVLRPGYSEQEALACEPGNRFSHRHLSSKQAKELLDRGEIIETLKHPATLLPRYVWRHWERTKSLPGASVIRHNAGAGETHEINHARLVLSDIASSSPALSSVISAGGWVQLPAKIHGSTLFYRGDGEAPTQAKPIQVRFGGRNPESLEVAREYLEWMRRSSRCGSEVMNTGKAESKLNFRSWRASLERLDAGWKHFVCEFSAGEMSQAFNECKASELPSDIVKAVLSAYLS